MKQHEVNFVGGMQMRIGIKKLWNILTRRGSRYAQKRENALHKAVPNGTAFGVDPCQFDSEQESLDAPEQQKYVWRKWYRDDDTLGLSANDFETEEEYRKARIARLEEKRRKERIQREKQLRERIGKERRTEAEKAYTDNTIYTFCGVLFPRSRQVYHYRTDDPTIRIGDCVLVPTGDDEAIGTVVSVGQYLRPAAPYPVEQTKYIMKKLKKER